MSWEPAQECHQIVVDTLAVRGVSGVGQAPEIWSYFDSVMCVCVRMCVCVCVCVEGIREGECLLLEQLLCLVIIFC